MNHPGQGEGGGKGRGGEMGAMMDANVTRMHPAEGSRQGD